MHPVSRTSPRLLLREISIDDVDPVHVIYGSAEATEHLSFEPRSRDQAAQIIARSMVSATAQPRVEYGLAVCERESGALIGYGRLALEGGQAAGTIGFALRPDAWGVGYGTETVQLLLGVAFDDVGLHRVWAARSPINSASERVLAKAGMTEEGRIRHHVHVRGAWRDSVVHSILEDEWQEQRAAR